MGSLNMGAISFHNHMIGKDNIIAIIIALINIKKKFLDSVINFYIKN